MHVTAEDLKLKPKEKPKRSTTVEGSAVTLITTTVSTRDVTSLGFSVSVPSSSKSVPLSSSGVGNLTLEVSTTTDYDNISRSTQSDYPLTGVKSGYGFDATIIHKGMVTEEQYKELKSISKYLMLILPEIGVVLNAFNIVIFSSDEMRSSFSRMLICLSSAELVAGVFKTVAVLIEAALGSHALYTKIYLTTVKYLSIYAVTVIGRTTFCYIFFIAAERVTAVVFPFKVKYFKMIKQPVVTCIAIFVFIALYHIQMSFKFDVVSYESENGEVKYKFALSSYYLNNTSLFGSLLTAGDIAFVYVPLLMSLVLNVALTVALRFYSNHRQQLQSTQNARLMSRSETQITVTVLVSSVLFILLVLPLQLTELVQQLIADYGMYRRQHFLFLMVTEIESLFYQLAFCTNFVCYYTLGGKFRKIFNMKICRCRMLWKPAQVTTMTDSQPETQRENVDSATAETTAQH